MKRIFILMICLFTCSAFATQRAVTDEGKVVILSSDGTWKFESPASTATPDIATNPRSFSKDPSSTFALKSTKNNSVFWLDTSEWIFEKSAAGAASEYNLKTKDGSDIYALAITEAISMDLLSLADVALSNAKGLAPDARVVKKEFRVVNGVRALYMEMLGSAGGIRFKYLGYYFSDSSGTTQYVVYTGENLAPKFETKIAKLLNGFSARK